MGVWRLLMGFDGEERTGMKDRCPSGVLYSSLNELRLMLRYSARIKYHLTRLIRLRAWSVWCHRPFIVSASRKVAE